MAYMYVGLLAFMLLVLGLAFVVYKWPLDRHKTFSRRAATNKVSVTYYFTLFVIVEALFIVFFSQWFMPTFAVSWWFIVFFIASAVLQIACTAVPDKGGRMSTWHARLAGSSALCLVPCLLVLLFTGNLPVPGHAVIISCLGVMAGCIYLTARAPQYEPRNFLLIQCAYFGAFLAPIMVISYIL